MEWLCEATPEDIVRVGRRTDKSERTGGSCKEVRDKEDNKEKPV
jgi:hypothetical protein